MSQIELEIINYIAANEAVSSAQIALAFETKISLATIKRMLVKFIDNNQISKTGAGKNTRYSVTFSFKILSPINIEAYFENEIDNRKINERFSFNLISSELASFTIFNKTELEILKDYQQLFSTKCSLYNKQEWMIEMERLAIDLSWKSSQIEGNTYSLLETEQLLKEKKTAHGRTKEEATMLLNHKEAIDFTLQDPDYMYPLSINKIENLHKILIKDLGVAKNIRTKRVGISGTNYLPLNNEWQIKEALEQMCVLVNSKENIFEKALLVLVLVSYIQPFMDGNKRTARIVSNSILLHFKYCPLSYRTVESIDYKKAMLLFYEVNNITAFKKIFIEQYKFAVNTYF